MCDFRFFGKFTLSETSGASVRGTPIKDKLHIYNSDIWRIRILTPPEEYVIYYYLLFCMQKYYYINKTVYMYFHVIIERTVFS
jgi:hypothetical protein